jgi:Tfp pilus assembly protein PilO
LSLMIVLAVSILCGYLAVSYGISQQRIIRQESESISNSLKALNTAEENLQNLREALSKARINITALNEMIPESVEMGKLIKEIDAMIKARKIALITIEPLPAVKEKLYIKIPIHIMFSGNFVNTYHLLHDIEGMNRLLLIEKIDIKGSEAAQDLRVDLTAMVFTIEKAATQEQRKPL